MNLNSVLLAISPSAKSLHAAESCWRLCADSNASLTALHVVDEEGAWEFLGYDEPGFLGSGLQVEVYENLIGAMRDMGRKLSDVYESLAASKLPGSELQTISGNPVTEILSRESTHDLIVVGHRRSELDRKPSSKRFSVAETLANCVSRPLIIVQDQCPVWKKLKVVVPVSLAGAPFMNDCLDFAQAAGLQAEVLGLVMGDSFNDGDPIEVLRNANPRFASIKLTVQHIPSDIVNEGSWGWWAAQSSVEVEDRSHTLEVIPTRFHNGERTTVFGSSAAFFIQHLGASAIMLWPEQVYDATSHRRDLVTNASSL